MADLTAEWCRQEAERVDTFVEGAGEWGITDLEEHHARYAQALRIAAAVLDERSVEGVASALREANGLYNPSGARAVLSYLRGEG